jgi:hypothetical protein
MLLSILYWLCLLPLLKLETGSRLLPVLFVAIVITLPGASRQGGGPRRRGQPCLIWRTLAALCACHGLLLRSLIWLTLAAL